MSGNLLEVSELEMRFQGLSALSSVSFGVQPASITAVIGPNGAGKTTLFNCVTGMYRPISGTVLFDGKDITGLSAHRCRGMAWPARFRTGPCSAG